MQSSSDRGSSVSSPTILMDSAILVRPGVSSVGGAPCASEPNRHNRDTNQPITTSARHVPADERLSPSVIAVIGGLDCVNTLLLPDKQIVRCKFHSAAVGETILESRFPLQ